jgi:hypothetical protein
VNVSGITQSDMSTLINDAVEAGWVYVGTKSNHTVGQIMWPPTGAVVNFSTTPKSGGWKTTAQLIFTASGVDLRRKGNARRSRKKIETSGFDPALAARQNAAWSREVEDLQRRHALLLEDIKALAASGSRADAEKARALVAQVLAVEKELTDRRQPFESVARL